MSPDPTAVDTVLAQVPRACESVKLACYGGYEPPYVPLYTVVRSGLRISPDCTIKLCSPSPCYWSPMTSVSVVSYVDVDLERLKHNYMLRIRYSFNSID